MGWTNATQSSDIESFVAPSEPAAKYRSRVRIETPPEAREGRPYSPSLGHPCPGAGSSIYTQREVPLRLGIRPASNAAGRVVGPRRGIPPILAVTSKRRRIMEEPRHQSKSWCRDQDR